MLFGVAMASFAVCMLGAGLYSVAFDSKRKGEPFEIVDDPAYLRTRAALFFAAEISATAAYFAGIGSGIAVVVFMFVAVAHIVLCCA